MTTHLIYAPINMRALNRWAGQRALVRQNAFDEGYALHVLLSGMFGKAALKPFRLFASERRQTATLYAYAEADQNKLQRIAHEVATPECLQILDPQKLCSKEMPTKFSEGQRLGFDIRVRPVRRLNGELQDRGADQVLKKGAEVDAFRIHVLQNFPDGRTNKEKSARVAGETRESVYVAWLAERLENAAEMENGHCHLTAFRRIRSFRGNKIVEGPDAILHGTLTVANPGEFATRLRDGIGRHKAYGYGMLLLRPAGAPAVKK